ncbi:hypothetical protein GGR51DRAFT_476271 [Nemania sp. FL0031]|nr:hypothetical protein GGR51DRAFT_476271 [Nemania sp. FL0031]
MTKFRTWGLHHGTILIACGIIANNAFGSVYLSYDPCGKKHVRTPRHGMLNSGDYWLQLSGREPPRPNVPSFCRSRKRRDSPSSQDGGPNDELDDEGDVNEDDAYEERWGRRSASRKRWLSNYDRCRLSYYDISEEDDEEDYNRGRSRNRDIWEEDDAWEGDNVDADVEDLPGSTEGNTRMDPLGE